jgi:hypothetical protein
MKFQTLTDFMVMQQVEIWYLTLTLYVLCTEYVKYCTAETCSEEFHFLLTVRLFIIELFVPTNALRQFFLCNGRITAEMRIGAS